MNELTSVAEISAVIRSKFSSKYPGADGKPNPACLKHEHNTLYPLVQIKSFIDEKRPHKSRIAYRLANWHVGLQSLTANLVIYPDSGADSFEYDGRLDNIATLKDYDLILSPSSIEEARKADASVELHYSDVLGWQLRFKSVNDDFKVDAEGNIWKLSYIFHYLPKV